MPKPKMLISELGRRLNVNPKTIRYYEEISLLPEPARNPSGYRIYSEEDAERLGFILRAKALDFSLEEIREILALRERGEAPCPYVLHQIELRIREVDQKIEQLRQLRAELEGLRDEAATLPAEEIAAKGRICHLIENRDFIRVGEIGGP
ncbi:MAG: heavy metal-responsive transcriptional regulator [Anaerolineae bacterium]